MTAPLTPARVAALHFACQRHRALDQAINRLTLAAGNVPAASATGGALLAGPCGNAIDGVDLTAEAIGRAALLGVLAHLSDLRAEIETTHRDLVDFTPRHLEDRR